MDTQQEIFGLVLAGGAGRRVSGRDKGLVDWRGKPLVQHVIDNLSNQVTGLYISCNRNHQRYARFDLPLVHDSREGFMGPLAGLESAAELARTHYLAVVPCDTPLLPDDLVARLVRALEGENNAAFDVSYAREASRDHYLCAVIRPGVVSRVSKYLDSGQRSVKKWYAELKVTPVDFSDRPGAFQNINRID